MSNNAPIRIAHLADLHLGCTTFASLLRRSDEKDAGRSLRETDLEVAIQAMTKSLCESEQMIDLVVIAGDIFHRATPSPWAINAAARMVRELVQAEKEVILIDGNHDNTADRLQTGSPLSFLRHLGAEVVNGQEAKKFGTTHRWKNSRLQGRLVVTAVPFDAVRQSRFAGVSPIKGVINILVIHGRVGDANLPDTNTLHERTPVIPAEVLRRGWDYVALGDWHEHKKQPLAGIHAYYSGSLEALTFSEAAHYPAREDDPWARGGALEVRLSEEKPAEVTSIINPHRRPVLRLQPIKAEGMDGVSLTSALQTRLAGLPQEALVSLSVKDCAPQAWKEIDWALIEALRRQVRRCDISHEFVASKEPELAVATRSLSDQWLDFITEQNLPDEDQKVLAKMGLERIQVARDHVQARNSEEGISNGTVPDERSA